MSGRRSLHDALEWPPDIALAEELCADNSVDVNARKGGETPIMHCCVLASDDQYSISHKYLKILALILKHPERKLNIRNTYSGYTGLHYLCCKADPPSVTAAKMVLSQDDLLVNTRDYDGMTPLMCCARKARDQHGEDGRIEDQYVCIIKMIFKHPHRNLNIKDTTFGYTVLHYLCDLASPPSVIAARMLLSQDDAPVNKQDHDGRTALMYCAYKARNRYDEDGSVIEDEYVRIMKLILKHHKRNLNMVSDSGYTVLHWLCHSYGSVLAAKILLGQPDICISAQTNDGLTPLHLLIKTYNPDSSVNNKVLILKEFMKHPDFKDCVDKLDNYGMSILDRLLSGRTFNTDNIDLAHSCKELLQMLLKIKGLVTVSGMTLALCTTHASPNAFKMLIDSGANVNDSLPGGETTAHCVMQKNSLAKFRTLFAHNPDFSKVWNYSTPCQLAVSIGCKSEILHELGLYDATEKQKVPETTVLVPAFAAYPPSECPFTANCDVYKPHISCTIGLNAINQAGCAPILSNPIHLYVKHNQCLLRKKSDEVKEIRNAVDGIFVQFANKLRTSKTCSHFAFVHFLCGSSADNTKCYEPNEMDFVCEFDDGKKFRYDHSEGRCTIHPGADSAWAAYCNTNGELDVRASSQAFYRAFAEFCHEYQPSNDSKAVGISSISFQFMCKISRIKCVWNGDFFKNMAVYADVVPAFAAYGYEPKHALPLGAKISTYFAIGKANRHDYERDTYFPISYCKAEYQMMTSLSAPLRQGFITAKAVRLASICAQGLDLKALYVVEDLCIEDYITSYALKTCLLILLQHMCPNRANDLLGDAISYQMIKDAKCTHCKYHIADIIYRVFQAALEFDQRKLRVWYETSDVAESLYNCKYCIVQDGARTREESVDDKAIKVCCRKRLVRLALIHRIRAWLTNEDNLRALHGGDECTCEYSPKELDVHRIIMARLETTGILAVNAAPRELKTSVINLLSNI